MVWRVGWTLLLLALTLSLNGAVMAGPEPVTRVWVLNDTGTPLALWTVAATPTALIAPDAPLRPGERRALPVPAGPQTWEAVAAPYADRYTAAWLGTVTVTAYPGTPEKTRGAGCP